MKIFEFNLNLIKKHNESGKSYILGVNHFADKTWAELQKYLTVMSQDKSYKCDDTQEKYKEGLKKIDW